MVTERHLIKIESNNQLGISPTGLVLLDIFNNLARNREPIAHYELSDYDLMRANPTKWITEENVQILESTRGTAFENIISGQVLRAREDHREFVEFNKYIGAFGLAFGKQRSNHIHRILYPRHDDIKKPEVEKRIEYLGLLLKNDDLSVHSIPEDILRRGEGDEGFVDRVAKFTNNYRVSQILPLVHVANLNLEAAG